MQKSIRHRIFTSIAGILLSIYPAFNLIAQEAEPPPDLPEPDFPPPEFPQPNFPAPTSAPTSSYPTTPPPVWPYPTPPPSRSTVEQRPSTEENPVSISTEFILVLSVGEVITRAELMPLTISSTESSTNIRPDNDSIAIVRDSNGPHPPDGAMPPPITEDGFIFPPPPTRDPSTIPPHPDVIGDRPTQEELDAGYQRGVDQRERERAEREAEREVARNRPPVRTYRKTSYFDGRFPGAVVIDDIYSPNESENEFTHKVVLQTRGGLRLVLIESSVLRDPETGDELIFSESAVVATDLTVMKQPEALLEEFTHFINAQGGTVQNPVGRRDNYHVTVEYAGPDTLSNASDRFNSNPELVLNVEYNHMGFVDFSFDSPIEIIAEGGIIVTPDTIAPPEIDFDVHPENDVTTAGDDAPYIWENGKDLGIGDG